MKVRTITNTTAMVFAAMTALLPAAAPASAQSRDQSVSKIVAAERAFAKLALESSTQKAFDRYLAHDAYVFRPRAMKAIEASARAPLPANLALTWEPEWADVSRAGDLGYTTGPWVSGARNNAQADPRFGQYLTIWRRQQDGTWMGVLDGGVATPAYATSPKKVATAPVSAWAGRSDVAQNRASLMRADNDFSAASKKAGYAAAIRQIARDDVRLMRSGAFPALGVDSVTASTTAARVTWWVPVEATTASSGDLGYTRGTYVVTLPGNKRESGDYVRVWKRDASGAWRVAVDLLMPA